MGNKRKNFFATLILGVMLFVTGCSNITGFDDGTEKTKVETSNIVSTGDAGSKYTVSQEEKNYLKNKFDKLSSVNEQTVGYIYVPGGKMEEPIVQDKEDKSNAIYLDKTFEKNNIPLMGAVFMDYSNDGKFEDHLTWLFGHARGSGVSDYRMFKDVLRYKDQKFFNEHPYVVVETPERKYYYEAVMIHEVHEDTELYKTDQDLYTNHYNSSSIEISKEEYDSQYKAKDLEDYFDKLSKSETVFAKKENMKFNVNDKYLILSTCPDFIANPETRYNLYLRQIPDSELNEFLEKNKDKLANTKAD
ncbi:sortase [Gemella sp. 19428wG2_WT2a]|nr:sortase [Gemella sp. 19428wG2_WT2a]TFU60364.1 sortase [Gemella sp. WT2a]